MELFGLFFFLLFLERFFQPTLEMKQQGRFSLGGASVHIASLQFLFRDPTWFVSEMSPPSGDRRAIDI